jgi:hypothetical protein
MDSKAAQAAFKARQLPAKEAALFKTLLVSSTRISPAARVVCVLNVSN